MTGQRFSLHSALDHGAPKLSPQTIAWTVVSSPNIVDVFLRNSLRGLNDEFCT
jgi:hypothetical protein